MSLSTDDLVGDRLFLDTAKTGVKVYIPLPSHVITALRELPPLGDNNFFWTRAGKVESVAGNYRRSLRALARHAGLEDVHPHRFRDTLAARLLQAGVPTERVAAILGHTDIRVTQRHYSAWIESRQNQTEEDVRQVWDRLQGK